MSARAVLETLQLLGWTLLLTLCQTTLLALAARAWILARARASARRHTVGYAALVGSLVLAIVTFACLRGVPGLEIPGFSSTALRLTAPGDPALARRSAAEAAAADAGRDARVAGQARPALGGVLAGNGAGPGSSARREALLALQRSVLGSVRPMLPAVAGAWALAAAILLLRLAGGVLAVGRIRRRALPLAVADLPGAVALARQLGPIGVEWLQSADIDAPAAVGWSRPAVLLPVGLHQSMAPELLQPLLAHELAHVRRHDTVKALGQGAADALLFFCPGARWLSAQVRLAREESCDDAAVAICGDRERCAQALAALVGVERSVPVLGAIGPGAPSLAGRIRRLVKGEDDMHRLTVSQAVLTVGGLVASAAAVLVVAGAAMAASAWTVPDASDAAQASALGATRVPSSYVRQQPGAPVTITRVDRADGYVFRVVQVRNISEQRITAVRFVALLPDLARHAPVRILESAPIAASLAPGEAGELRIDLLRDGAAVAAHAQPMLGLVEARFADGDSWAVHVDSEARDAEAALYLEKPSIIKALVGASASNAAGRGCRDHRGFGYSRGAVLPVTDGPPAWARCVNGAWLACDSPMTCPALPSE